ncbi:MAG TPA: TonB-dependent receptor [Sphingomonas sp.]|nr:TonB-dependent receptor [Sphingomonas sp.]
MNFSRLLGATALASASFILPQAALAQATDTTAAPTAAQDTPEAQDQEEAPGEQIVVTGTRIRAPNLESNVPITSISGEEIFQQGQNNLGDTLNDLPQLRSTFAQQNPGLGIGIAGLNLLDLRGLGTQRTLTLVNGRRHVASDLQNNAVSVDVNTIPNDLIERIEIVTGGNSAIYGSDAIAGVVNFILKKDFEGIQVRGGAGISEYGAGGNQFVSALVGKNFADGRGNITLHGEFANQDRVYGSDIPFMRRNDGFVVVDTDPAGLPGNSDGIPDRVFMRDIRTASISQYGVIPVVQPTTAPGCGVGIINGTLPGTPYNCTYVFNGLGQLSPQTGSRTGTGPIGGIIGGNGITGREGQLLSVLPFNQRYNFNLLAHYEFSPAAELFLEAKYANVHTIGSNSGPAFNQGAGQTFGDARANFRLDNPFLTPDQRTTIANAILASGFRTSLTGRTALTAADQAAIAAGSFRFVTARNLIDLGLRDEDAKRETYRAVIGLRGTFNDDWSYEVSANYGRTNEDITILGNVNVQRLLLAFDAGFNPATGRIQCRSQFVPGAGTIPADTDGIPAAEAALAADIAACVPYNPFGAADNSAARDYIVTNSGSRGHLEQLVFNGYVSGDTSQWFELPGGPVRFAIGGEYRREDAYFKADDIVESGVTFLNALQTFDPDAFEVKEAFAELQLPLLKDIPFIESLTLSGAARVSSYQGATGTVWAYNGGVEWAPIHDIRFRANFARAVRAPNYTETADPLGQDFAPGFQDPCRSGSLGAGSQYRAANCAADLGALAGNVDFNNLPTYSLEILSGSNPDLREETSDSWTIGAVIEPRFTPGLSLTVDYYNIKVNNVIVTPTAQQIVNSCYDLPDLNNQFCALFERWRGPGTGPNDEVPGEILTQSLEATPLNFASRVRKGIDVEAKYRTRFGEDNLLSTRFLWVHQFKNSNYQDPTNPDFENRLLDELGDPTDEFRWNIDLKVDRVGVGYEMRYIGPMLTSLYEDFFSLQGRQPQNADWADIRSYPAVLYHDIRFDYTIGSESSGLNFFFGVDNITDKDPPLGSTATGPGSAIYNVRGRTYYSGFRARF